MHRGLTVRDRWKLFVLYFKLSWIFDLNPPLLFFLVSLWQFYSPYNENEYIFLSDTIWFALIRLKTFQILLPSDPCVHGRCPSSFSLTLSRINLLPPLALSRDHNLRAFSSIDGSVKYNSFNKEKCMSLLI